MLAPNTLLLDKYVIARTMGSGESGAVYLGYAIATNAPVAIKQTWLFRRVQRQVIERTVPGLLELDHPALPRYVESFFDNEEHFLIMEFIPGDDLNEYMHRAGGPVPLELVLAVAETVAGALDYLHTRQPPIVHRNVRPENIKLTPDDRIVLMDIGLSAGTTIDETYSQTLDPVAYTPVYASPEELRGVATDARSDIFSLGTSLYALLTGTLPPDPMERMRASMMGDGPDPMRRADEILPSVPETLADLVARATALHREARPRSAAEIRASLDAIVAARRTNALAPPRRE